MTALAKERQIRTIAWSPDGRCVATGNHRWILRTWDVATGREDHTARVWNVSWNTAKPVEWRAAIDRGEYRINSNGVLVTRSAGQSP